MTSFWRTARITLMAVLLLLVALLILQALGYGIGFVIDPESGAYEFGHQTPTAVTDLTVTLVGFVGVGMLGIATLLILSAILILRSNPVGTTIAMIIGGNYLLASLCAFRAEWWWDARFYGLTGVSLIVLSAIMWWVEYRRRVLT